MAPTKRYHPDQMLKAIEAVKKGSNVLAAAKKFGVPRITLRNKITGISPMVCGMGPTSILTKEQESMFVQWLYDMSDKHCQVGKEHLLDSVQQFVIRNKIVNPFTNDRPGKKWFYSFLKRHPGVSERISQNFFKSRDYVTQEKLKAWFSDIYDYLQKNKLQDIIKDPRRIFTSDEAAFYLNPSNRALVKRNASNIYSVMRNKKENPQVFLIANAAGQLAPPMVVFANQRIHTFIEDSIPEGWGVGTTKTGWMCAITLYKYMKNIFHPWLIENGIKRPVIYFLDGDATNLTYQLSEFCSKNQIELLSLYPNTTQILKAMDVALFRPLRAFWKKECNTWKVNNHNQPIKKEHFGPILEKALKSITPACIQNGFKVGGLFPFGHKDIDFTDLRTENIEKSEPDPNDVKFLNTLEKEIVVNFTQNKIDLFNTHYKFKNKTANDMLKEDETLYTIWSKYKDKCQDIADKYVEPVEDSLRYASSEHEITRDQKRFTRIRQRSLEIDLEAEDSDDSKRTYISLSEESNEETPIKRLPSKAAPRLLLQTNKNAYVKISRLRKNEEQKFTKTNKPAARTFRKLRQLNTKQLNVMLEQEQIIKQEPLCNRKKLNQIGRKKLRKRGTEKETQIVKRPKKIIKKEKIMSSEDATESETNLMTEYESDESAESTTPNYVKEEVKQRSDNCAIEVTQGKELSPMDIVKEEIENDSVIIYVTDNDVNILYC